jgi:hypothetical protein
MVNRGKFLIRPPELSGNPTRRVIWKQAGGMGQRDENLTLRSISFILASDFYIP